MITKAERLSLFTSSGLQEIPADKRNSLWSSVDNVWRIESRKKMEWKLVCRLIKKSAVPKRRKTILKPNLCSAYAIVSFERDDVVLFQIHSPHSHSLDLSDSTKKAVAHDYLGFKYVTMSYLRSIQRRITSHEEQEQQTLELTVEGVLLHNLFQVLKKNLPSGRVIAFMNSAQLELIRKYGNGVVFMDSTEKTNSKKYYYVTAVVRTDERKWMALFQFWTSSEHSELYEASLRWALEKSGSSWKPASFVIDGYRMEEKAVYSVFGNTVKIFNCTRHSLETLKTKVRQSAFVLENMKRALFASSYRECLNSWQEALSNCPYDEIGRYLPRAWPMERSHIWSVYPRQSGQWAEVTTSNPVESFFSRVKKVVNINMSLVEATNEIVKLLKGLFEQLNEQKEKEGVSCVVGVEKVHSSVSSWKMSNQRLILKEFEAAQKYVEEGILDSLYIQAQHDGACKCKFYRFN